MMPKLSVHNHFFFTWTKGAQIEKKKHLKGFKMSALHWSLHTNTYKYSFIVVKANVAACVH